jgi:hypothetical protein
VPPRCITSVGVGRSGSWPASLRAALATDDAMVAMIQPIASSCPFTLAAPKSPLLGRPRAFYRLRDDGLARSAADLPDVSNVFAASLKASMPATARYFAWGCFRYF